MAAIPEGQPRRTLESWLLKNVPTEFVDLKRVNDPDDSYPVLSVEYLAELPAAALGAAVPTLYAAFRTGLKKAETFPRATDELAPMELQEFK